MQMSKQCIHIIILTTNSIFEICESLEDLITSHMWINSTPTPKFHTLIAV